MKLHKAIKKLNEGYRIRSEIMNIGYLFIEDDKIWFTSPGMNFQILFAFDHDEFDQNWEIYNGPI